ncbi:unnamed protein product [Lactuca saligna]|uniref:Uncharacterized protein n=1 Tax=Lactuca saligna TaxID=75948 RepID=A0AA35ZEC5_LACSI|nr:unnamed protein product [Lactuca saligna]
MIELGRRLGIYTTEETLNPYFYAYLDICINAPPQEYNYMQWKIPDDNIVEPEDIPWPDFVRRQRPRAGPSVSPPSHPQVAGIGGVGTSGTHPEDTDDDEEDTEGKEAKYERNDE